VLCTFLSHRISSPPSYASGECRSFLLSFSPPPFLLNHKSSKRFFYSGFSGLFPPILFSSPTTVVVLCFILYPLRPLTHLRRGTCLQRRFSPLDPRNRLAPLAKRRDFCFSSRQYTPPSTEKGTHTCCWSSALDDDCSFSRRPLPYFWTCSMWLCFLRRKKRVGRSVQCLSISDSTMVI